MPIRQNDLFAVWRRGFSPREEGEDNLPVGHETLGSASDQTEDKLKLDEVTAQRLWALGCVGLCQPWAQFGNLPDGDRVFARAKIENQIALPAGARSRAVAELGVHIAAPRDIPLLFADDLELLAEAIDEALGGILDEWNNLPTRLARRVQ